MAVKFFFRLVLLVLPALLVVAAMNYVMDPALRFHDSYVEKMAQGILEGQNAIVTLNYDDRKLQRELISGFSASFAPKRIFLGSSRILHTPVDTTLGNRGFNNGVTGARMEDFISIVGMYEDKNMLPDVIVISLDPWLFNANYRHDGYKELLAEYNAFADELQLQKIFDSNVYLGKIGELFSPSYFQSSIGAALASPRVLVERIKTVNEELVPFITKNTSSEHTYKMFDGSRSSPEDFQPKPEAEMNESVQTAIHTGAFWHADGYRELSPAAMNQFESLIDFLENNHVAVVFILPPLHPIMYEHITVNPDLQMIIQSETYIRTFAGRRGIRIVGSFDPSRAGAGNTDFYDWAHPTRAFMSNMCKDLL